MMGVFPTVVVQLESTPFGRLRVASWSLWDSPEDPAINEKAAVLLLLSLRLRRSLKSWKEALAVPKTGKILRRTTTFLVTIKH